MKNIKQYIVAALLVLGLVAVVTPVSVGAACTTNPVDCAKDGVKASGGGDPAKNTLPQRIKTIVNILLYLIGAIAVIMIVIGGIRYVTSGGDSAGVTGAKNTILYAVVGVVVAILAFAIVNFVLDQF